MAGRYDYELGNATGLQYGDTFDGAQLSYDNSKMTATAGYGKFKEGDLNDTKTAYGELEGKFGGGSAAGSKVGVFYNNFNKTNLAGSTAPDDLWGTYASVNFGKKFNLLGEYQNVNNPNGTADADVFYGKLQYGKATMAQPKSWDLWVDYLNAEKNGINGSTGNWRTDNLLGKANGVETWGAGVDYTFAKNAQFQVMQSFASKSKDSSASDPDELTRAQFVFAF